MTKTLLGSLREYKKGSILTILLSVLEAAFEILIPLRMADLIDQGIEPGEMAAVWKFGTIILVFAALQLLTGVLSAHVAAKTSVGFSANLRQDMYDNVQTFAFSNIDKFSTASIVTRLTTDVTNLQNAYQMLIRMAVRGPVMLIFSMIVSFRHQHDPCAHLPCGHSHHGGAAASDHPQGRAAVWPRFSHLRHAQQCSAGKCPGHPCGKILQSGGSRD